MDLYPSNPKLWLPNHAESLADLARRGNWDEFAAALEDNHRAIEDHRHAAGENPTARVSKSSSQTIPNATDTYLTWDTFQGSDSPASTIASFSGGANDRITYLVAGWYLVIATVVWTVPATGSRGIKGNIGAASPAWSQTAEDGVTVFANGNGQQLAYVTWRDVNDIERIQVHQDAGANLGTLNQEMTVVLLNTGTLVTY